METLCRLLGRSRQAYYQRERRAEKEAIRGGFLVNEVRQIRERQKRIGGRKLYLMTSAFRSEHSITMGRDAFFDLLRDEGLLVRKRRRKKPRTTFSCWWRKKYPNLIKEYHPIEPNRVWVSDITYVRVGDGFCYLSLVTDAYSRKIVGFHLNRDLTTNGCVSALRMAIKNNPERHGLIHHSDRGLQYYSNAYLNLLGADVRVSMSERSDPLENAIAERVNGILKDELLAKRFASFGAARREVAQAVSTYNNLRPHSSIDMLTPAVAHSRRGPISRRWKNYRAGKYRRFTLQAPA